MNNADLLHRLEKRYEEFIVPLRMGDGFDTDIFKTFCETLTGASEGWAENDSIPKRAVMILVDAHSAMISASYLYDEVEREKIDIAADDLSNIIRQSVE